MINKRDVQPIDVGVWFVAQRALAFEPTRALGEQLADRARLAAANFDAIPAEALRTAPSR